VATRTPRKSRTIAVKVDEALHAKATIAARNDRRALATWVRCLVIDALETAGPKRKAS